MPRKRFLPVALLALALAACGSSKSATPADTKSALDTPTTLTFWTWVPNIQKTVDMFQQKYPNIKVKVVNAGQSADEYTKLQTAVKAGSGAPDVAQIEYFALPQFALAKQVVNLNDYGAATLESSYGKSAWAQ